MKLGLSDSLVVPEASARYGEIFRIVPDADHITICRPVKKISTSFNTLTSLLRRIHGTSQTEIFPQNFKRLPKQIIGLDYFMEVFKAKLCTTSRMGLVGMSGIGKTTLAKALFNDLVWEFEYTCFLEDVSNIKDSIKDGLVKHMHYRGKPIVNEEGGLLFLRKKRLLLILDNVFVEQDLLAVDILWNIVNVHEESRFIATSRDLQVLSESDFAVHDVPFLSLQSGKKLLVACAFRDDVVPPPLEPYVNGLVKSCQGMPLTLEVIGNLLYKKSEEFWKDTSRVLKEALYMEDYHKRVWATLRLSYDCLDYAEQEMFLDATNIFYTEYGGDWLVAKEAWAITTDVYQENRWQHLLDLSLIREDGELYRINDQFLILGRMIASERETDLRIWKRGSRQIWSRGSQYWRNDQIESNDLKALKLLTEESWTLDEIENIVALKLNYTKNLEEILSTNRGSSGRRIRASEYVNIRGSTLSKMRNLKYLFLGNTKTEEAQGCFSFLSRKQGVTLPSSLVCLWLYNVDVTDFIFDPNNHKNLIIVHLNPVSGRGTVPAMGQASSPQVLDTYNITASTNRTVSTRGNDAMGLRKVSTIIQRVENPFLGTLTQPFGLGIVNSGGPYECRRQGLGFASELSRISSSPQSHMDPNEKEFWGGIVGPLIKFAMLENRVYVGPNNGDEVQNLKMKVARMKALIREGEKKYQELAARLVAAENRINRLESSTVDKDNHLRALTKGKAQCVSPQGEISEESSDGEEDDE